MTVFGVKLVFYFLGLIAGAVLLAVLLVSNGLGLAASAAFGGIFLLAGWQIIASRQAARDRAQLLARLKRTEKHAKAMEKALKDTRSHLQNVAGKVDGKNQNVVSELKLLQTLLKQVVQKNLKIAPELTGGAALEAQPAAPAVSAGSPKPATKPQPPQQAASTPEASTNPSKPVRPAGVIPGDAEMDPASAGGGADCGVDEDDVIMTHEAGEVGVPAQQAPVGQKARGQIRLIKKEAQLLEVIQSALSENRVDLYLQPIVGLPARKTRHFECLSRVRDEQGRIILPRHYMKIAEAKGLVGTIDNLLLFRLIQLVRRLGPRRPDMRFFCNLSAHSAKDPEFFPQFIDFMQAQDEFTDRMVFEVSQEDYLTLGPDVLEQFDRLGKRGFRFSMEGITDFNLDLLQMRRRHFGFLKADMATLSQAMKPADIRDLVGDSRRHEIALVASRVENEEKVLEALEGNAEYAQGYHFSEPKPADSFAREF